MPNPQHQINLLLQRCALRGIASVLNSTRTHQRAGDRRGDAELDQQIYEDESLFHEVRSAEEKCSRLAPALAMHGATSPSDESICATQLARVRFAAQARRISQPASPFDMRRSALRHILAARRHAHPVSRSVSFISAPISKGCPFDWANTMAACPDVTPSKRNHIPFEARQASEPGAG